jgi:hypothetical protein
MKFFATSCLVLVFGFSSTTFASSTPNSKVVDDFVPLIGSGWAAQNPKSLPFSTCFIHHAGENLNESQADESGFIRLYQTWHGGDWAVGAGSDMNGKETAMICYSLEHGIAYKLPIQLSRDFTFPAVGVTGQGVQPYSFSPESMDNKTVKDLEGAYWGGKLALSLVYSCGSCTTGRNSKKISFSHIAEPGASIGVYVATGGCASVVKLEDPKKAACSGDPYLVSTPDIGTWRFVWDQKTVKAAIGVSRPTC